MTVYLLIVLWLEMCSFEIAIFEVDTALDVEAPIIWPHDAKSQFIGKDAGAGKDRRLEENG